MQILVGSPVRQEPQILSEFLTSLLELDSEALTLDFIFVDDNDTPESQELLRAFWPAGRVEILPGKGSGPAYEKTAQTHLWREELIWRVASYKDEMIRLAREQGYDGLFLVDSDLVMHPRTLQQLVAADVEIVSEVFWTRWTPQDQELPQVWLRDQYTLHAQGRNEQLSAQDVLHRQQAFLTELRQPGVYEVGGLGALTFIRKPALDAGVSFAEVPALGFWGEDRHFCIRAQALGLKLHVDTHYPALHLYRKDDLGRVAAFKRGYAHRQREVDAADRLSVELGPAREQPDVVLLSSIDWDYLWQRPQHLAEQFTEMGCRVVYVDRSAVRLDIGTNPGPDALPTLMLQTVARSAHWEGRVAICQPITEVSFGSKQIDSLDMWLDAITAQFGLKRPVFWVMGWHWGNEAARLKRHGLVVYDCVDDLGGFSWATPELVRREDQLIAEADVIMAVSPRLTDKLGQRHPYVYLLPNGVNPEPFSACEALRAQRPPRHPVIGFVGALAEWVDTQLIAKVARANPMWHFLLVGSEEGADMTPLRGIPNVLLTGRIDHAHLAEVLAKCDVGIVPFRRDRPLLDSADAIKIYEYIAAGLPVVSTPFGQIQQSNDLIYVAGDAAAFGAAIEQGIQANSPTLAAARRRYAEGSSWRIRAALALGLMNAHLAHREGKADQIRAGVEGALTACAAGESAREELLTAHYTLCTDRGLLPELEHNPLFGQMLVQKLVNRRAWAAARALCESLAWGFPNDVEHQYNLAAVELAMGDSPSALQRLLEIAGRLEATSPIPEIIYALGEMKQPALAKRWEAVLTGSGGDDRTLFDLVEQTKVSLASPTASD